MIVKNNTNEILQSNEENNIQRKAENVFPKTSIPLPEIEFIFDEKGNRLVENWIMN